MHLCLCCSYSNEVDIFPNTRQGTKRYMAPEVVNLTINKYSFDSYKQSDMYSFGLVLWEIARRTVINGVSDDCQAPYYDCVGTDPSFDEMKKIVCEDGRRPVLAARWSGDQVSTPVTMRHYCRCIFSVSTKP